MSCVTHLNMYLTHAVKRAFGRLERPQIFRWWLGVGNFEVTDFLNMLPFVGFLQFSDVKEPKRLVQLCFISLFMHSSNKQYVNLILPEKSTGCLKKYITCYSLYLSGVLGIKGWKVLENQTMTCLS